MKKFLLQIVLFAGLALCIILPPEIYKMRHVVPSTQINPDVYNAIENSLQKTPRYRYLVMGDSMGMQLYPCDGSYSNLFSLTCNQAITFAGHYFLLNNYLEQNKDSMPDDVILIYNPISFRNNTDVFTFHYFLKPFFTDQYKGLYTESLWKAIKCVPFYWLSQFPIVNTSSWSVEYHPDKYKPYSLLSPISSDYLKLMINLLKENNINFRIIAPPLSDMKKSEYEQYWKEGLNRGEFEGFEKIMTAYHNSFQYFPDSLFLDSIHLLPENIPQDFLMIKTEKQGRD